MKKYAAPWRFKEDDVFVSVLDANGVIFFVTSIYSADTAKLIAAAPTMLMALKQCAVKFDEYASHHYAKGATKKTLCNQNMSEMCKTAIQIADENENAQLTKPHSSHWFGGIECLCLTNISTWLRRGGNVNDAANEIDMLTRLLADKKCQHDRLYQFEKANESRLAHENKILLASLTELLNFVSVGDPIDEARAIFDRAWDAKNQVDANNLTGGA